VRGRDGDRAVSGARGKLQHTRRRELEMPTKRERRQTKAHGGAACSGGSEETACIGGKKRQPAGRKEKTERVGVAVRGSQGEGRRTDIVTKSGTGRKRRGAEA